MVSAIPALKITGPVASIVRCQAAIDREAERGDAEFISRSGGWPQRSALYGGGGDREPWPPGTDSHRARRPRCLA